MTVLEGLILGLVQGLTEFLPVSSSGHLALGRAILNDPSLVESPLVFDVAVHVATLLAIVIYFRREVMSLVRGFLVTVASVPKRRRPEPGSNRATDRLLFLYVFVASVPTAIIGLLLKDHIEGVLQHPVPVGVMLLITGTLLFVTRKANAEGRPLGEMKPIDAIVLGVVQGIAVLPGISRSGSTIGTGIILGLERKLAARFSFLIAVPAIAGAAVLELPKLGSATSAGLVGPAIAGAVLAFVSGYAALVLLIRVLEKRRLAWFAPYCWLVGIAAIILGLVRG